MLNFSDFFVGQATSVYRPAKRHSSGPKTPANLEGYVVKRQANFHSRYYQAMRDPVTLRTLGERLGISEQGTRSSISKLLYLGFIEEVGYEGRAKVYLWTGLDPNFSNV